VSDAVPDVEVRPPAWVRLYLHGIGVVLVVVATAATVTLTNLRVWQVIPVAALLAAAGGLAIWRTRAIALVARGDELLIGNFYGSRRLRRDEIDDFRMGTLGMSNPLGLTVHVLLADGTTLATDAMMWSGIGRGSRGELEAVIADLRRWHRPL
jgi:hypothetical protein